MAFARLIVAEYGRGGKTGGYSRLDRGQRIAQTFDPQSFSFKTLEGSPYLSQ